MTASAEFDIRSVPFGTEITIDEVIDTLGFFDDWEDRYRYIIDLGKQLPGLPEELKTEDRFVRGCQSQVWLEARHDPDSGRMHLAVDSDALIVKGLAAIVLAAMNNKTPDEVINTDMEALFAEMDLIDHLSPTRGNGLRAMVARIKKEAEAAF
jgi:cysteine desulfuration protein SufE